MFLPKTLLNNFVAESTLYDIKISVFSTVAAVESVLSVILFLE